MAAGKDFEQSCFGEQSAMADLVDDGIRGRGSLAGLRVEVNDGHPSREPLRFQAEKRLRILEAAALMGDLAALNSNRLEALRGTYNPKTNETRERLGRLLTMGDSSSALLMSGKASTTAMR